jgi:tRNA (guanine37-N1)-methyltransferase
MLVVKVPKKKADLEKKKILSLGLFNTNGRIGSDLSFVYFPVLKKYKTKCVFVEKMVKKRVVIKGPTTLREGLKKVLTVSEMKLVKTAYDQIGAVAILDIPEELVKKETKIASVLLDVNPKVETVLKKVGIHSGKFRLQKLKVIAGKKTKVASYKENGIILKMHLENVYFSPRSSTERKRVCSLVKKGEDVLVMFSGCSPYCCSIGKNTLASSVVSVEINPVAHKYAQENVHLNKLVNVSLHCGDVRKIVPCLRKKFDRVIMPLPKDAEKFLDVALSVVKKKGVVHLYSFGYVKDITVIRKGIKDACKVVGAFCRILKTVKCGQYSPKKYRFCTDFKVI